MLLKKDKRRKYDLDIEPFMQDSHGKYYWLGFLATDGNVGKVEPRIRLELKDIDLDALEKLSRFCNTNLPIKYRTNNKKCNCARLEINSSELKQYLSIYNIVPNKTQSFTIPLELIPDEYIWDFMRGMMDGDGCITILKTKKYCPYGIEFSSANKTCVEQVRQIWGLPDTHAITEYHGQYIVSKYGKNCLTILDNIYKNSTEETRLNRKYERYRSLVE